MSSFGISVGDNKALKPKKSALQVQHLNRFWKQLGGKLSHAFQVKKCSFSSNSECLTFNNNLAGRY